MLSKQFAILGSSLAIFLQSTSLSATDCQQQVSWTSKFQKQDRVFVHYQESNNFHENTNFKDDNWAHMLSLGFDNNDVNALEAEAKAYILEYYGLDFHNLPPLPDGSYLLPDGSAILFPEKTPNAQDQRTVLDSAYPRRNNDPARSFVNQDTGMAVTILAPGTGVYGGKNAGMNRLAGDIMVYGYVNTFDPQKPIHKCNLVERIKFKPTWPIRAVAVPNVEGANPIEAVFKVEAEYVDKKGYVHNGVGISGFCQRFDTNGTYYQSKRTTYTFPHAQEVSDFSSSDNLLESSFDW
jgi:hypothetical protein